MENGGTTLLSVAKGYLGHRRFAGMPRAWCAASPRKFLREGGYSVTGTDNRAISFARYGRPTSPHVGAVAVLRHHVGIVAGFTRSGVVLLSGNHGRGAAYGLYAARKIVAFRELI
jgi:hypothetical protein